MAIANASLNALGLAAGESAGTAHNMQTIAGGGAGPWSLTNDFERPSTLTITGDNNPDDDDEWDWYQGLWTSAKTSGFLSGVIDQHLSHWAWSIETDPAHSGDVGGGTFLAPPNLTLDGNDGSEVQIEWNNDGYVLVRCVYDDGFNAQLITDYPVQIDPV